MLLGGQNIQWAMSGQPPKPNVPRADRLLGEQNIQWATSNQPPSPATAHLCKGGPLVDVSVQHCADQARQLLGVGGGDGSVGAAHNLEDEAEKGVRGKGVPARRGGGGMCQRVICQRAAGQARTMRGGGKGCTAAEPNSWYPVPSSRLWPR